MKSPPHMVVLLASFAALACGVVALVVVIRMLVTALGG